MFQFIHSYYKMDGPTYMLLHITKSKKSYKKPRSQETCIWARFTSREGRRLRRRPPWGLSYAEMHVSRFLGFLHDFFDFVICWAIHSAISVDELKNILVYARNLETWKLGEVRWRNMFELPRPAVRHVLIFKAELVDLSDTSRYQ